MDPRSPQGKAALLFDAMLERQKSLTALLNAIEQGNNKIAMLIINKDVTLINDVPHFKINWRSPFYAACRLNNLELVKFMIDNGADVNQNGVKGEPSTALHAALYVEPFIGCGSHEEEREIMHTELVRLLFESGAKVPRTDLNTEDTRQSCVYWACKNMHPGALKILLEHGANPNNGFRGLDAMGCRINDPVYIMMRDLLCATDGVDREQCKAEMNGGYRRRMRKSRRKGKKQRKTRRHK